MPCCIWPIPSMIWYSLGRRYTFITVSLHIYINPSAWVLLTLRLIKSSHGFTMLTGLDPMKFKIAALFSHSWALRTGCWWSLTLWCSIFCISPNSKNITSNWNRRRSSMKRIGRALAGPAIDWLVTPSARRSSFRMFKNSWTSIGFFYVQHRAIDFAEVSRRARIE